MTPLVLLHGWGAVPQIWQPLLHELNHPQVHNLALPGYSGGSWGQPVKTLLAQLPAVVVDLVGWSLGGNLAMAIAHTAPAQLRSVTTIATAPAFVASSREAPGLNPTTFTLFCDSLRQNPLATLKRFASLQAKGSADEKALAKALRAQIAAINPQVLIDSLNWLGNCQQQPLWCEVTLPRLHLFGGGDALINNAIASDIKHSAIIPAAGHAPLLSQPAALAAQLQNFWATLND